MRKVVLVITVVNHIEFAYIRPVKTILVHSPLFLERFTFSDEFYRLVGFLTAAENHLVEKPMVYSDRTHTEFVYLLSIQRSLCSEQSIDLCIFWLVIGFLYFWTVNRSVYFWAICESLYFWAVHRSLYSDRSMDPYISGRSVNRYILTGPWTPIFWPVDRPLYSEGS